MPPPPLTRGRTNFIVLAMRFSTRAMGKHGHVSAVVTFSVTYVNVTVTNSFRSSVAPSPAPLTQETSSFAILATTLEWPPIPHSTERESLL
jgi:hypothetical protein